MSILANKLWIVSANSSDFPANEPPFGKILAYDSKIQGVYLSGTGAGTPAPEDRFVTAQMMSRVRSFGLLAGAQFVPRSTDAKAEAAKADAMCRALNPDAVMLDVESHDVVFQRAFVTEYRKLRPGKATDVSFEPRQDGSTVAVDEYIAARFDLFPQLYRDNMRPADAKRELRVWTAAAGWDKVHLVVDAKLDWWDLVDGVLYDAETLPDKRVASRPESLRDPEFVLAYHDTLAKVTKSLEPFGDETEEKAA